MIKLRYTELICNNQEKMSIILTNVAE